MHQTSFRVDALARFLQAPNAASRQQVQSRTPQLPPPRGRIQLDDEPDVREVGNLCAAHLFAAFEAKHMH